MRILAIETSCDETAVAVVEATESSNVPKFKVLGDTLLSQAMKHREFGGVYPSLAKREHAGNLVPVLIETLKKSELYNKSDHKIDIPDSIDNVLEREPSLLEAVKETLPGIQRPEIDAIAVTQGPGLEPALWVGLNFAKALSIMWNLPLIPTNHMEGHIVSVLLDHTMDVTFPAVALLVSGGHTQLVLVRDWLDYEILGGTKDDAVGEAFDKAARMLGLPYPGGPEIEKLAAEAVKKNLPRKFELPRPMRDTNDYDFSYSGLKTALLYKIKTLGTLDDDMKRQLAKEFTDAAFEPLLFKATKALENIGAKTLIVSGGVSASPILRNLLEEKLSTSHANILFPDRKLSTDNAVMIAVAGYLRASSMIPPESDMSDIKASGTLAL